jgi:CheY-like chemotaxis protein
MPEPQCVTVLLVEDDPGHARLIEKNLRRANLTNPLVVLSNGALVLDYVFRKGVYAERVDGQPLLILLDLNLPVIDGYQVLQQIRADERTSRIPVAVLTTTDDPREVARCYELGCSVYVTKPVEYSQFSEAIRRLGLFLAIVSIPEC